MNNAIRSVFISVFFYLTCSASSFAQTPVTNAELLFNNSIKEQSRLYNGLAYEGYPYTVDGSANFQNLTVFSAGSVIYQGFRFDNLPLMYDIFQDKLISVLASSLRYSFISDRVSEFYLNKHHFKYIKVLDSTKSVIKSGFYDLIHDGKSKIYVKHFKNMQTSLEGKVVRYYFIPKTAYYIERDQKYSVISGEKSFFNYFKDKKPQLKNLLKEKKIKFRKQPEEAMILLASYYESLTN
jgi:hypothetical protein